MTAAETVFLAHEDLVKAEQAVVHDLAAVLAKHRESRAAKLAMNAAVGRVTELLKLSRTLLRELPTDVA